MNAFFLGLFISCVGVACFGSRAKDVSILRECLWNRDIVYGSSAECNDMYNHYPPVSQEKTLNRKDLRIGSFNLYRLGLQDTQLKSIEFIAKMFNDRWDIVALSEIHHSTSQLLSANAHAIRALHQGMPKDLVQRSYRTPGYLKLLLKIQELDSSWGLVVTPSGQGSTGEMLGFLYRNSKVQPSASKYCEAQLDKLSLKKQKIYGELHEIYTNGFRRHKTTVKRSFVSASANPIACYLKLSSFEQKSFARVPFVSRFVAGKFDFSLITLHSRFNTPDTIRGKCEQKCRSTLKKMKKSVGLSTGIDNIARAEVARFFEANATLNIAQKVSALENDQDTIVVGDFNLEYGEEASRGRDLLWNNILQKWNHSQIFIESRTSLSKAKGLSQNYDHFIFTTHAKGTSECREETTAKFNFTETYSSFFKRFHKKRSQNSILREYLGMFKDKYRVIRDVAYPLWHSSKEESEEFLQGFDTEEYSKVKRRYLRANRRLYRDCVTGERYRGTYIEALENDLYCRVFWQSPKSLVGLLRPRQSYRIYTELVSDHMPIEMRCRVD